MDVIKCSTQELLDKGLSQSILTPIHKTILKVDGIKVLNFKFYFIQMNINCSLQIIYFNVYE